MNKPLLPLMALCAGLLAFILLHRSSTQARFATALIDQQWHSRAQQLAATQEMTTSLRDEVRDKNRRLQQALRHPDMSQEMLLFLEGNTSKGHLPPWAELRQQLGLGWDSSPDYVLVSKQAINGLEYSRLILGGGASATEEAIGLLGLTPDEQSTIASAFDRARKGQWLNVERGQPSGDIVAQYTISPPDPVFEQSQSNNFATDITAAIGPDRSSLYLPQAWNQFLSGLATTQPETMTIRQVEVDGQPDLTCEVKQGDTVSTEPVRYARYPGFPILTLFPNGWKSIAQMEGFDLPPSFQK